MSVKTVNLRMQGDNLPGGGMYLGENYRGGNDHGKFIRGECPGGGGGGECTRICVIPFFKGFPGWRVHFWSYFMDTGSTSRSNQRSKVTFGLQLGKHHLYWLIICGSLPNYYRMSGFTRMDR